MLLSKHAISDSAFDCPATRSKTVRCVYNATTGAVSLVFFLSFVIFGEKKTKTTTKTKGAVFISQRSAERQG